MKKSRSLTPKETIQGIAGLIIIAFLVWWWFSPSYSEPKSYEKVNTISMIQSYEANEAKGDEIYKNKYIEFSGVVSNISSGLVSGATVNIDSYYGLSGVDIDTSLSTASKLEKGQTVTFKGQVMGRIMGIIQVTDGKLVSEKGT